MKKLLIYPTSRALRRVMEEQKSQDMFLPSLMRTDEFEHRAIIMPQQTIVDPLHRILLLREASDFEEFKRLKIDKELVRFFSRSDSFFKFFEELSAEGVSFDDLMGADAYVEFDEHLEILQTLRIRYEELLNAQGLTDKAFIPNRYKLNQGFIDSYDQFELHLEGYLSHHELSIIIKIAKQKPFLISMHTSKFTSKMMKRFEELGIILPPNHHVHFDLHSKKIIFQEERKDKIDAKVFRCEERLEQIPLVLESIQKLVDSGIPPQEIVLILPDEAIQEQFHIYDKANNFNFAMGFSYKNKNSFKRLDALYRYLQAYDSDAKDLLLTYGIKIEELPISATKSISNKEFFQHLETWELLDIKEDILVQRYSYFIKLFHQHTMVFKNWLYLWLQLLSEVSIDDVRGGKITVMGVLESRGIHYKGVIIVDVNEGIVPVRSNKDRFLNTAVRAYSGLPTKTDRESLQKYFYQRILEQAQESIIFYASSDNRLPSKFLYELGLAQSQISVAPLELLYNNPSQIIAPKDPIINNFDASFYRWSTTMLKCFIECKRHFYYRYLKELKIPKKDEINEGLILHEVLERVFKNYNQIETVEELQRLFHTHLLEYIHTNNIHYEYYTLLWKKRLEGFFYKQIEHFKSGWSVKESEYKITGTIEGLRFIGKIDRLDQNNTNTLVIDYKTGSTAGVNRVKNLEKLSDFQMSIYHELLQQKEYKSIELGFIKLFDNGEYEPITLLEEKTQILKEHINSLRQTHSFVAKKCENLQQCLFCDYKLNCERGEYL